MKKKITERKRYLSGNLKISDYIIIAVCIVGIISGCIGIYASSIDYLRAEDEYSELSKYVRTVGDTSKELASEIKLEEESEIKADLSDRMFDIDWTSLRSINSDIVGWIVIPGTPVNYPIVQTVDNAEYLHKSFEGTKNACGTIFLDTYNRSDFSDWNSVIYGHNMKNGSMFACLNKFKKEEYYKEHKDVWLLTPCWERKYQIVSAHPAKDGSDTYSIVYPDETTYQTHLTSEVNQTVYDTGNGYNLEMPMITLSTCTGRGRLDRFVLICQPVYETRINPFIENKKTDQQTDSIRSSDQ